MMHHLRSHGRFFLAAAMGLKDFEIRKNDRDFQVGDTVVLHNVHRGISHGSITRMISYISNSHMEDGFVVLQLKHIPRHNTLIDKIARYKEILIKARDIAAISGPDGIGSATGVSDVSEFSKDAGNSKSDRRFVDCQKCDYVALWSDALKQIAAIENKLDGGDWDEIEEAREIANKALSCLKSKDADGKEGL